jgi:O-acetylhomoserine (thiol)-lyase
MAAGDDKTKAIFCGGGGQHNAQRGSHSTNSAIAKKYKIPFIVVTTFVTPVSCELLCPVEFGADLVIHRPRNNLGGHGSSMCGSLWKLGTFPWKGQPPSFPNLTRRMSAITAWVRRFGPRAFIARARVLTLTGGDFGPALSPFNDL